MERKKKRKMPQSASSSAPVSRQSSDYVWCSVASAVVLWASFAPLGWGFLGWAAPLGWVHVAAQDRPLGRRGYVMLWLTGCLFWLAILQGIRLAYWPLYLGWLALALYLAIYVPLFVGLTRVLRNRGVPLLLAAPATWVSLELLRSYLLSGYCANMLAHSQAHYPLLIQIADHLGAYGISLIMMIVCVALYQLLMATRAGRAGAALPSLVVAVSLLLGMLGYGGWRLREADRLRATREPLLRVLLVQENTPTVFDVAPESLGPSWRRYLEMTRSKTSENGVADLVVWPESTFAAGTPWVEEALPSQLPTELVRESLDQQFLENWIESTQTEFDYKTGLVLEAASRPAASGDPSGMLATPHLLLGSDAMEIQADRVKRFNTALFVGPDGKLIDRYDKMHLVMFGEYIPLGPLLQWLRDMFGLPGAEPGTQAKCFAVGDVNVSPNICFESMMPRLIVWQVRDLRQRGEAPDILINVTNDSWFRGSSMLDHHLACSILCAVENRRPMLVAANSGLSADIDGAGRVLQRTQRGQADGIWAEPIADARWGLVQWAGYPLAWLCAALVLWHAIATWWASRFPQEAAHPKETPRREGENAPESP